MRARQNKPRSHCRVRLKLPSATANSLIDGYRRPARSSSEFPGRGEFAGFNHRVDFGLSETGALPYFGKREAAIGML